MAHLSQIREDLRNDPMYLGNANGGLKMRADNWGGFEVSGAEKLTRSSLKGLSNRALSAYKNGRFARSFLLLGIGFLERRQICLSKVALRNPFKPHRVSFCTPKSGGLEATLRFCAIAHNPQVCTCMAFCKRRSCSKTRTNAGIYKHVSRVPIWWFPNFYVLVGSAQKEVGNNRTVTQMRTWLD